MATWVDGVGVGNQLFSFKRVLPVALLILIAICASVPTLYAQSQSERGFVSLDCGSAQASYNDSYGLEWVADDAYMTLGSSHQQNYAGTDDKRALKSFRDFPGDRRKYCYEIQTPFATYLIRVSFYMDHSELIMRPPFQFIVSVDGTNWFTVTSGDNTTQSPLLVVQEGIFYPPNPLAYLCLHSGSGHGKPFISSLEVRCMDYASNGTLRLNDMYSYNGHFTQYLALAVRYNAGAQNLRDVRYPADPYDRIWTTPDPSVYKNFTAISNTTLEQTGDRENLVPLEVMHDAMLFPAIAGPNYLSFQVYSNGPHVSATPSQYAYFCFYLANLNVSYPVSSTITIGFGYAGHVSSVPFSTSPTVGRIDYIALSDNGINVNVSLDSPAPATAAAPSINALEVFSQVNFNASITTSDDAEVITLLKSLFSLTDWQGDPCVPVPFNWLTCDVREDSFGHGQQQCTESCPSGSDVSHSVFATFFNVTTLNISNVANTNFSILRNTSALPRGRLHGLNTMSITSSGVDYSTFLLLLDYTYGGLTTLNLSYNAIVDLPRATDWAGTDHSNLGNLTTLDLSHNNITGVLSSFNDVPFSITLQNLNLSYNNLTSFPGSWKNTTIKSLVTLKLSHNQFSGDISSLDQWIQINSESLQEFDISYNSLTGGFSSGLYFSLPNITYANFDYNSIQGTLDLSSWYDRLQNGGSQKSVEVASNDVNTPSATKQVFSFMNNQISDIHPRAKDFNSAVRDLFKQNPSFGILLDGNPYCNDIKSPVQKYLCRPSLNETFQDDKKNYTKLILILSIVGGVVALLFFSITSATLWKLWRQLFTLRGIQKALAERKVHPPFYQYTDLKAATKQFHKSNKLGHGGFGVVYKGVLKDETLAIKKLFNSQQIQVIDEFLNEVMLITGIKHRNLIQLKGCCIKDKQRILVYEYAERGNLAEALWGSNVNLKLTWKHRLNICVGIARGLSYLHEELQPYIIHRDIKPENILLDLNLNPKIADFGLARHVLSDDTSHAHYTQIAGTLGYFAPEYATQGQVSQKIDVYSYGILILEVVTGRKCIDSSQSYEEKYLTQWVISMRQKSLLFDILQPELKDDCDAEEVIRAINIALLCVQHHPDRRPTMSEVVTMFLGNMDIKISTDEFDNFHSNFRDLLASVSPDVERSAPVELSAIDEEASNLDVDSGSSFDVSGSGSSSRPTIEMRALSGR